MKELLKAILKLPDLELSNRAWQLLSQYYSHLSPQSHTSTNSMLAQLVAENKDEFEGVTLTQLKAFFKQWLVIARIVKEFKALLDKTWLKVFKSPLKADQLLPLIIELLPNDSALLKSVLNKLDIASRPSIEEIGYSFANIWSAIKYKLASSEKNQNNTTFNYDSIYSTIVNFGGLQCLAKSKRLINKFQEELIRRIHSTIKTNDTLGYQLIYKQNNDNLKEGFKTILDTIYDKNTNELSESSRSLIAPLLSKYYACTDLMQTIDNNNPPIEKLYEFYKKTKVYSPLLSTHDLTFFQSLGMSQISNPQELGVVKFLDNFIKWATIHVEPLFEVAEKKRAESIIKIL